ncbi:MAG: hypothetical protein ABIG63_15245, partial [Chloroflexota bacterium]
PKWRQEGKAKLKAKYGDDTEGVNFASCTGQINVMFQIVDYADFSVVQDSTIVRAYNVPTAIELVHFSGSSKSIRSVPLGVFAAGLLGLVFAGGAMVLRKKNSK